MRRLGWTGCLLVTIGVAGCGSANSLEDGVPEDAPYVPAPKIEFRAKGAKSATKSAPAAPATTEAKK